MSTAWGPSHLLFFYQPLGDELVDRRFHKARRNTFSTSLTLPVVDDTRSIVVDIGTEFFKGASQFLQYQVGGPPRLAIFNRAVHLKYQVSQRLISAEFIAMPQKPFYTLKFFENLLFAHRGIIRAAESASRLRELLNAHRDVKPIQDVLGLWMKVCRQFAYRFTSVGQKGDVLSWQHPLSLQHFVQSTFGFCIDPPHARKYFGRAFFRNTPTGNDLKTSGPTALPLATTDVAAIQANRHWWSGLGRPLDLVLASSIESKLLGTQFRFESLRGREHMHADSLAVQARIDGQHVV